MPLIFNYIRPNLITQLLNEDSNLVNKETKYVHKVFIDCYESEEAYFISLRFTDDLSVSHL